MQDGRVYSRQSAITEILTEQFKQDAAVAVEKSLPEIEKILFKEDVDGKNIFHAILDDSYEGSYEVAASVYKSMHKNINNYFPRDTKDAIVDVALEKIKMGTLPNLLCDFDVLFEDLLLTENDDYTGMVERLTLDENKKMLRDLEKNKYKIERLDKSRNPQKILILSAKMKKLTSSPIGVLIGAMASDDLTKNVEQKIYLMADVLRKNGFPQYRDVIFEKIDGKKAERLREKSRIMFPQDDGNFRIDYQKIKKSPASFRISDYDGIDPYSRVKSTLQEIKNHREQIAFWKHMMFETEYKTSELTDKLIDKLERKALPVPSLKDEILSLKNIDNIGEYIEEMYQQKPKAKEVMDEMLGIVDGKLLTNNKVKEFLYDLGRFYLVAQAHKTRIEGYVRRFEHEVEMMKNFVQKYSIPEKTQKDSGYQRQSNKKYKLGSGQTPIAAFLSA